jgi:hypothetical protein
MRKTIVKAAAIFALGASAVAVSSVAMAEEWPMVQGDYWEVTGIDIKDGGSWKYANWLATEWRKNLDYAVSQGWLKDYKIVSNVYGRSDEPDLYLIRIREDIPSGAEGERRMKAYEEWSKKTAEQMVGESGNRAEYREVMSSSLLQEMTFRD